LLMEELLQHQHLEPQQQLIMFVNFVFFKSFKY
jgi:hypothetical protein